MSIRNERSFFRKTKGNALVKLVREQYLREDIPCMSEACGHGCENKGSSLLSSHSQAYFIPDLSVILRYLEILEDEEMKNIIFSQTLMMSLQQNEKTKTYRKIRQIISDPRRKSVMFYNEIFQQTKVHRRPNESAVDRDWRSLVAMAQWYRAHFDLKKEIVILTEQTRAPIEGIWVVSTQHYLNTFYAQHTELYDLSSRLAEAILEEAAQEEQAIGKIKFGNKKSNSETAISGFVEYKCVEELELGIKLGRYVSGTLKCKKDHRDQAYITANDGRNLWIVGNEHRNRAVHGDSVVVEPITQDHRVQLSNVIENANPDQESATDDPPSGRVVGILNRHWRSYVATLQEDSAEVGGTMHLAVPLDPVIPKIRIRYHDPKLIENQRIVVRIDSWPVSAQYPNGHFVKSLGPIHVLDTEISAILVEHDISLSQATKDFSEASLQEMPRDTSLSPWKPEQAELERRRDLRDLTVFSIDPPNCQDIDDALSVKELSDGNIELGVHIADVSYFVKENSMTDLEGRSRGTTVYLADRRFDMLPDVLSERVCSLRHHVDRYAVSVIWTMDSTYNVLDTWFGRSVIHSSCEMEYEQAQEFLNGAPVARGLSPSLCQKLKPSVEKLAKVLRVLRDRRLKKGALELESSEVKFKITEQDEITDIVSKESIEIHGLVAEAMILANASVGKRIYEGFQDAALLRQHPPPSSEKFEKLVKAAESKGFSVDFSSNRALSESLESISKGCGGDPESVKLLKTMATMAMNEAGYISSGHFPVDEYFHYGLALPFYTHFTSPIRRYADIVAHRQLLLCVQDPTARAEKNERSVLDKDGAITEICENLNRKSRESKFAQRDSTELFQSLYVLQKIAHGEPLIEKGIISEIRSNGFYVFVPRLGIKGPVYLKEKDGSACVPLSLISGKSQDEEAILPNCQIEVRMPTSVSVRSIDLPYPIDFCLFDHVRVSLKLRRSHAHRHLVYMTLVDTDSHTRTQPLSTAEMASSIHLSDSQELKPTLKKKKKNVTHSMYEVLERFRKIAITQVTTASDI
ncbi:hypothetical protein BY458DRAFT_501294 [Sporodiniella umbellata]|nr:hypothetical protein BY458DRAFT_501294 [Sporodiniella umbellata]